MKLFHARRSGLFVGVLGLACGAWAAIAIAAGAPGEHSHHRPSHITRRCHRTRHHGCPKRLAAKNLERGHKRGASQAKPAPPGGTGGSGGTAPWATLPPSAGPGASGPGTSPTNVGAEAPPAESPSAPAGPAHVEVTAEDTQAFRFVLSRPTVPAGKVIIEFVNHGQDEHNLHVLEPAEGSEAGALPNTVPNAHPSLTLDLRPGSYTLFCSLPGHEAAGMKATLVVN